MFFKKWELLILLADLIIFSAVALCLLSVAFSQ